MSITFYYGAGSPYAWRVWLALEHKRLDYRFQALSFSDGDLSKPQFTELNPRRKVPVIEDERPDGRLVLYESAAIVEYLEEAYPGSGMALFPASVAGRALVRRMICEADSYVGPAVNRLLARVLMTPEAQWNEARIAAAREECVGELAGWSGQSRGDYLAGPLSAADLALYPMAALALRCERKRPDLALRAALPPRMGAWMQRMEALPAVRKTWPPHWN